MFLRFQRGIRAQVFSLADVGPGGGECGEVPLITFPRAPPLFCPHISSLRGNLSVNILSNLCYPPLVKARTQQSRARLRLPIEEPVVSGGPTSQD